MNPNDTDIAPEYSGYLHNGVPGERFFYPASHTNVHTYQSWDTPYEYSLLRSHAIVDDLIEEMAGVIQEMGLCGDESGHEDDCPGCIVIKKHKALIEVKE